MEQLNHPLDKLNREVEILDHMVWSSNYHGAESAEHMDIVVQQAKRVRRECNVVLKALAARRDHLQRTSAQGEPSE